MGSSLGVMIGASPKGMAWVFHCQPPPGHGPCERTLPGLMKRGADPAARPSPWGLSPARPGRFLKGAASGRSSHRWVFVGSLGMSG